jgi:glucose/arabinose dehydrogenase
MVAALALLVACGGEPAPAPTHSAAPPSSASSTTQPAQPTQPAATEAAPPAAVPLDRVRVRLQTVVQLQEPIALATRPDDATLYVAERAGVVRAVRDGKAAERPVLDIRDVVLDGGERGLLGITFSAGGDELYASYTNLDGDTRLVAYRMEGEQAAPGSARELLAVDQPFANHNGGNVVLGPDGMLYLGLGDGGAANDPERNAQDPATLLGKLVRVDPGGRPPPDNPFVGDDLFLPEIYALGLRNPWRFSFDRKTADLWVADVGQNSVEEINMTPAQRSAGRNYGWDIFEGTQPFEGDELPPDAVVPVEEYPTSDGCAVTGGFVYRGRAIPQLDGAYLYGDYCAGFVRALRVKDGKLVDRTQLDISLAGLASFGEDSDGELYLLSLDGEVAKLVSAS